MTKHTEEFLQRARDAKQRISEVSPAEARAKIVEGALAADTLQQMGYTRVFSIQGGLRAYEADQES